MLLYKQFTYPHMFQGAKRMQRLTIPSFLWDKKFPNLELFKSIDHPLKEAVYLLILVSDYAARYSSVLYQLLDEDPCLQPLGFKDYQLLLWQIIPLDTPLLSFAKALRYFRHRHLLRLYLRELAGLSSTQDTMAAWSDCADAILLYAKAYCERELVEQFFTTHGYYPPPLLVIGMGKLGGQELNFSSDIDLIFAYQSTDALPLSDKKYPSTGRETKSIVNHDVFLPEFYQKIIKQFVYLLQHNSAEGFVFRVDLRLRPYGDSGPLAVSSLSMEAYYQEQGRDWERYAMVKARVINAPGAVRSTHWFYRLITPFIYRRYSDYGVIAALRNMKGMIVRELQLNPMLDDIKRGQGGIREIEFTIQVFQLVRGGRLPELQQANAIKALHALKKHQLLVPIEPLEAAYLFLRQIENAIQLHNDKQTHTLPTDTFIQAQISLAMGYERWEEVINQLQLYRQLIRQAFNEVLGAQQEESESQVLHTQLISIWQGHVEANLASNLLAGLGFNEAERCYQLLQAFRQSPRYQRLSPVAHRRLDQLIVLLLHALISLPHTEKIILLVIQLLENIVARSAYLALLTENPLVLKELLHWFTSSPFITAMIVNQPFLLEVFIDQETHWQPLSRQALHRLLKEKLAYCSEEEEKDECLRQFKLTCFLLAARAELYGKCQSLRIGRFLADVAQVIITAVVELASERLSQRYPRMRLLKSRFAIVAYGKLGAQEMNYDSDVDLVFLHVTKPGEEHLVTRLTQKIIYMLTMRLQSGLLYSVDTRLRPSGSAGLLVSSLDAFSVYQKKLAWTWEHQALLRARVVYASSGIRKAINVLKADVFNVNRPRKALIEAVKGMRNKLSSHHSKAGIKQAKGGLLDIEFIVQFLLLSHPSKSVSIPTNTLAQLRYLYENRVLNSYQYKQLKSAYTAYHKRLHQHVLQSQTTPADDHQATISALYRYFFKLGAAKKATHHLKQCSQISRNDRCRLSLR